MTQKLWGIYHPHFIHVKSFLRPLAARKTSASHGPMTAQPATAVWATFAPLFPLKTPQLAARTLYGEE